MRRAIRSSAWLALPACLTACGGPGTSRAADGAGPAPAASFGRPTVFPKGAGDRLVMRGTRPLFIVADSATVGSRTLVAGYEDVPAGDSVRVHKHLGEDEILFIHRGVVDVTLGDRVERAEAGASVFIPRGTWIGVRVVGADTAGFFFVFNTPAFEKCLRMLSARPGAVYHPPAADVAARTSHECHMILKGG